MLYGKAYMCAILNISARYKNSHTFLHPCVNSRYVLVHKLFCLSNIRLCICTAELRYKANQSNLLFVTQV